VWRRANVGAGVSTVDENVVAVVPFRVSADPSLGYLREGMLDLMAAKLTGEGGPRAADPRAVMSAWRSAGGSERADLDPTALRQLARRLGAGRLLLGSIVGAPSRLTISASVQSLATTAGGTPVEVAGPADSLPRLIDRLTAKLLAQQARTGDAGADALAG
jgi:hypothetical protein